MVDERDEAGEAERPVQPPVIDLEAEEVRADDAAGAPEAPEAPEAETVGAAKKSRFSPALVLVAGLVVLIIAAGSWAAFTLAPRGQPEAKDFNLPSDCRRLNWQTNRCWLE